MNPMIQEWTETNKAEVLGSVKKMLASALFASSPRQQRFLEYMVTHTMAGNADRLKGYTIGVEVFDRTCDFDPSVDAIVRVEATRLRNKLREYYDGSGKADEVRIDFPKGGYQLNISFQPAVDCEEEPPLMGNPAKISDRRKPALIVDRPSLAVLPFVNIGADNSREYFTDGVTDSLISILSRLSGLFIISRQSSFALKDTMKSSKEIAEDLGVRYLLEGSVQHAGEHVRVAAHLIDANDGGHIWSERYDRELKNIFVLQDELMQHIVHALQIKLAGAEAELFGYQDTHGIEAHDTLLRGVADFRKYTPKSVQEAVTFFTKTIQLDPNYATAHAWLARAMAFQWALHWIKDKSILDTALMHAQHAVELSPHAPYAMCILGWVQLWRRDSDAAIAACRQAVTLDPNNGEALLFLSVTLSSAGFAEEALYYIEKAKRLTPISAPLYEFALGQCYYLLKEYKKAIAAYEQGIVMSATFIPNHYLQLLAYAKLGMFEEAKKKHKTLKEIGFDEDMPSIAIWTNEALAQEQIQFSKKIFALD